MLLRPTPPLGRGPVTRRAALRLSAGLGSGVLALLAAGCGADRAPGGPARAGSTDADPDGALVDRVLAAVRGRLVEVVATRSRVRALRAPLWALEDLHRAHLAALDPGSPSSAPEPGGAGAGRSRSRLRRRELAHQELLSAAALEARSGALARLLASMSAGVGAHLAALDGDTATPRAAEPPATQPPTTVDDEDDDTTRAWQEVLGAEHAAVYVLGVLGARTSQTTAPVLLEQVRTSYAEHRDRRDDLIGQVAASGSVPRPAATAYEVPVGSETAAGVTAAAVAVEQATASSYAVLVAGTTGAARGQAVDWLADSSIRVLALRGTPEMFPGADEYADR